jgi:hypothetical protein
VGAERGQHSACGRGSSRAGSVSLAAAVWQTCRNR